MPLFWRQEGHLFHIEHHAECINQEMETFSLEDFPLIEDFEVRLTDHKRFGSQVEFFSQKRGLLAYFPYWDHAERDLCKDDFVIPCEYADLDQGWELFILADSNCIYILQGDFDHHAEGYDLWFKVKKEHYLAKWEKTIYLCKKEKYRRYILTLFVPLRYNRKCLQCRKGEHTHASAKRSSATRTTNLAGGTPENHPVTQGTPASGGSARH